MILSFCSFPCLFKKKKEREEYEDTRGTPWSTEAGIWNAWIPLCSHDRVNKAPSAGLAEFIWGQAQEGTSVLFFSLLSGLLDERQNVSVESTKYLCRKFSEWFAWIFFFLVLLPESASGLFLLTCYHVISTGDPVLISSTGLVTSVLTWVWETLLWLLWASLFMKGMERGVGLRPEWEVITWQLICAFS